MEERKSHFERPTNEQPPFSLNMYLLIVAVAIIAGLSGAFLGKLLLSPDQSGSFNFINAPESVRIVVDQPLVHLVNKNQKSIAGVYKISSPVAGLGQELLSADDFLGSASVITSDGWLLSSDQVIKDGTERIALNGKIHAIEQIKKDDFSGAVFAKIGADSLLPLNFQLSDNVYAGEKIFGWRDLANSLEHSLDLAFLQNKNYYPDRYLYSDKLDYYLQIAYFSGQSADALAAPYFNLDGYLVGVVYRLPNQKTALIPAPYLRQAVRNLLNDIDRPKLGLRYVDMENNSSFDDRKGNLIFRPQLRSVEANLPGARAGIRAGDVVLAVNNDLIAPSRSLTALLQNYRPGDKVIIKILRNNTEMDLEVAL
ncbi:MAG: S1C family serine protease [Patescibacteria group bacterium]|nr:S1C family serine protease [Patescibacteria group bacterium]